MQLINVSVQSGCEQWSGCGFSTHFDHLFCFGQRENEDWFSPPKYNQCLMRSLLFICEHAPLRSHHNSYHDFHLSTIHIYIHTYIRYSYSVQQCVVVWLRFTTGAGTITTALHSHRPQVHVALTLHVFPVWAHTINEPIPFYSKCSNGVWGGSGSQPSCTAANTLTHVTRLILLDHPHALPTLWSCDAATASRLSPSPADAPAAPSACCCSASRLNTIPASTCWLQLRRFEGIYLENPIEIENPFLCLLWCEMKQLERHGPSGSSCGKVSGSLK